MFKKKNDLDKILQEKIDQEKDINKEISIVQQIIENDIKREYLDELMSKQQNLKATIENIREKYPNIDLIHKSKFNRESKIKTS